MSIHEEMQLYYDLRIIRSVAMEPMHKQAGLANDMVSKVRDYVGAHVDPNDKLNSLLNILGPGAISMTFRAMGLGWIGLLAGLAMSTFHINITDVISSIWSGIKSLISRNSPITSSHVDNLVNSAMQQHANSEQSPQTQPADDNPSLSLKRSLTQARRVKLAMLNFEQQTLALQKQALPKALSTKAGTVSVLSKVLSVLFKVALASAGLMVAGDVINKFVGRPNAIDKTVPEAAPAARSKQTKFPVSPSYSDTTHSEAWAVSANNDPSSIENVLLSFAKEVYPSLSGKENLITQSPNFQKILSDIIWYNHVSAGDKVVIIPKEFKSKKDLVDYFVDDVAKAAA